MAESLTYNIDCMEYMKTLPDNYFDLCVTDPPYGDGIASEERADCHNLRGRFSKYDVGDDSSQIVNVERERDGADNGAGSGSDSTGTSSRRPLRFHGGSKNANDPWNKYLNPQSSILNPQSSDSGKAVTRTGGTWAEKYGKKS